MLVPSLFGSSLNGKFYGFNLVTKPYFSGKFFFPQYYGEMGKNGPKNDVSDFFKINVTIFSLN